MPATHSPSARDARLWRQRLLILRGLLVMALALLFIALWLRQLTPVPVITVLLSLTLLWSPSLLLLFSRRHHQQQHWLAAELLLDVLFFTLFLQQVGGSGNPLAFYLLLPALLAGLALPLSAAALIALATMVSYSSGLFWQPAVQHHSLHAVSHDISDSHLLGMWLVFCLLAIALSALGQALQQAQQRQARQRDTELTLLLQRERMYQVAARLADQAHELNTPLNSLLLIIDDLAEHSQGNEQAELVQVRNLALRMADTIRQPQSREPPQTMRLSALCQNLAGTLSHLAPGLVLNWHGPEDPLLSPASDWQRVLANLGYNACDARAQRLEIRCEATANGWLLQVSDDGPQQAKHPPDTDTSGLGLGLALIETTLARHQATLTLLHEQHWTVARIVLPASANSATGKPIHSPGIDDENPAAG